MPKETLCLVLPCIKLVFVLWDAIRLLNFFSSSRFALLITACFLPALNLIILGERLGFTVGKGTSLSGMEVEDAELAYLRSIINNVTIFYRVTPKNKVKIVKVSIKF